MANLRRVQQATQSADRPKSASGGPIVGNAWVFDITKGKNQGKQGLSISFNRSVKGIDNITSRTRLAVYPNTNVRPGKRDPEFLVVLNELPGNN